MSAVAPAPLPGRYQARSGTAYQLGENGIWHRVYRNGLASRLVAPSSRRQRDDLAEITANPAAAAVRAGRCPHCQTPCGPGFDPKDCRSTKHAEVAS